MKIKISIADRTFTLFNTIIMLGVIIITLYPMLYILFGSLSDSDLLLKHTGLLFYPQGFNFQSYVAVFQNPRILTGYQNTLFILVFGIVINIIMTALGAYFLSCKELRYRKFVMIFVVITMFFTGGIVPRYLNIQSLGLYNSIWSVILPVSINTFNLIIMRTAFEGVPVSLKESANLDGASDWTILFRIIMPLTMPTIAVVILYYGVAHWNSWLTAVMYIQDKAKHPLQVILREILIQNDTNSMTGAMKEDSQVNIAETVKYATIIVATLPILAVYPFLQKYFAKGAMVGAVKE